MCLASGGEKKGKEAKEKEKKKQARLEILEKAAGSPGGFLACIF